MSDLRTCQCGKTHNFNDALWDISMAKGYRGKYIKCECGKTLARMVPVTSKLKELWNSIRFGKQSPTPEGEKEGE